MKHATRQGAYKGMARGWPGRWASSCRYYSVNASVNTPRDVFRKARISRRLLILVIAGTCTSGALNGRFKGGGENIER